MQQEAYVYSGGLTGSWPCDKRSRTKIKNGIDLESRPAQARRLGGEMIPEGQLASRIHGRRIQASCIRKGRHYDSLPHLFVSLIDNSSTRQLLAGLASNERISRIFQQI